MQNIAAYIRVSSDKQDVARQQDSIKRWSERSDLSIAYWFEDSQGRNPRDLAHKRKGFQRLLKAVEARLVDCIIVDSQDRFGTRDAYQWGSFLTLLRDNGCLLLDSSGKDLSADDDLSVLTGTLGAITSTREQKEKAHRNVSGKLRKARLGEYQGGNPPYGLDVVCFHGEQEKWRSVYVGHYQRWKVYPDGKRERFDGKDNSPRKDATDLFYVGPSIEKDRLKIVRQIFNWYATEAISPHQIAERLNDLNVDPVFGNAWNKVKIQQLLRNPVYIGLPTWNKRAGSRFAEYVGGQIQDVKRTNGKISTRRRTAKDYVQPCKPLFKRIIDEKTWEKVQAKIAAAKQPSKQPAQTAELWLKPFLICSQCGKPMRATLGKGTKGLYPSYYCGTYGTYGRKNKTGCHCHRVKHDLLEQIVLGYVKQMEPKVVELIAATQAGNLEAAEPLIRAISDAKLDRSGVFCEMLARAGSNKNKLPLRESYGLAYERLRPRIEAKIAKKDAVLDKMLDQYGDLTGSLRQRARAKMDDLQHEIEMLRRDLIDWRQPFDEILQELKARQEALERAKKILSNGAVGRQKSEVLSSAIDRIICHFRHTLVNGQKNNGKSYLDKVEIVPNSGDPVCFTVGIKPVQD